MRYSFDDVHIGTVKPLGRALYERIIRRPRGLTSDDWYRHASDVCKLLNKETPNGHT